MTPIQEITNLCNVFCQYSLLGGRDHLTVQFGGEVAAMTFGIAGQPGFHYVNIYMLFLIDLHDFSSQEICRNRQGNSWYFLIRIFVIQ
jgi:hypothetical protein